jgi:membrane protein implicated in regulation of membrane protease activity
MELLRGIFHDTRTLSVKEFTAAKLEIREEISHAVRFGIFLGVGLFALATGVVILSIVLALVVARYSVLPVWASLAIVGAVYTFVGLILVFVGKRKMKGTTAIPQDTLRSTKEDVRYIRAKAMGRRSGGDLQ